MSKDREFSTPEPETRNCFKNPKLDGLDPKPETRRARPDGPDHCQKQTVLNRIPVASDLALAVVPVAAFRTVKQFLFSSIKIVPLFAPLKI
jgi:hypothetical protein